MKIDLHLEITNDSGTCQSIALCTTDIDATASIPTLGLSLADGKAFLSRIQTETVSAQIAAINVQRRGCVRDSGPVCAAAYPGHWSLVAAHSSSSSPTSR